MLFRSQTLATGMLQAPSRSSARLVGLPLSLDGVRMGRTEAAPELGQDDQLLLAFMDEA